MMNYVCEINFDTYILISMSMAFLEGFIIDYCIKNKCMILTFLVMDLWAGPRADFSQY